MGCGCGKSKPVASTQVDAAPRAGDWQAVYPSGDVKTFTGPRARASAVRTALASGGSYRRVTRDGLVP